MGRFPSDWEDLVNSDYQTIATVYTRKEAECDGLTVGVTRGKDGVYDIVIDAPRLTRKLVCESLGALREMSGVSYRLLR